MFPEQTAAVELMLQVSGLTHGDLECDIYVTIAYENGSKASKLL